MVNVSDLYVAFMLAGFPSCMECNCPGDEAVNDGKDGEAGNSLDFVSRRDTPDAFMEVM